LTGGQPLVLAGAGAAAIGYTAGTYGVTGSLNTNSVSTISGANQMINSVDAAIQSVDSLRSSLGAIQNRFQSVINSLSSSSQNLTSSRASIMDTNFASETAVMTQQQILQQAGTAILAQANASPQSILKLIQ
jgi:flagellin